ncbi:hypothetical protein A5844_001495 [Enterococcus sp. 10A9_DIV0425]|uniref:Uncharacterized protein n=1 Tax=Candidatus Enterococcus wittei TaxID=1987383 RepID=A0A242K129_9ENTE|nr:hypothetical protein [Enterococcus sp. 10A9_DIV0425]OTP11360.1 hypothetical protein A5844_001495 [Enterococcus sp. 10A9_DIV0425]THE07787.1 hypothetical protein E1H99_12195 [Enterococcus hirae]
MKAITFQTTLTSSGMDISFEEEQILLQIRKKKTKLLDNSFYIYYEQKKCLAIGKTVEPKTYDAVISVQLPWDLEADYFMYLFYTQAIEAGLTLEKDETFKEKIPAEETKKLADPLQKVTTVLTTFGYLIESSPITKKKPAKARHRWTKKVSEIPFTVDFRDSHATLYWISRNEMLIKAGATLLQEAPLNKDGSVGYAAKYGEKLRDDYKEHIVDGKTVDDIIVKSVNEASLLLYFGGTNSWLEIKDEHGKTIDEWTKVE